MPILEPFASAAFRLDGFFVELLEAFVATVWVYVDGLGDMLRGAALGRRGLVVEGF